jgi:hypothetical protein
MQILQLIMGDVIAVLEASTASVTLYWGNPGFRRLVFISLTSSWSESSGRKRIALRLLREVRDGSGRNVPTPIPQANGTGR